AALLRRADAYYEREEYAIAQVDIDRALNVLPAVQSNQLKVQILADAGLIHAQTVTHEMDRTLVLSYFSLAAQINAPNQVRRASHTRDDNFVSSDTGMLHLRTAMALCAPRMKGTTADSVRDLLESAQRLTDSQLIRQHVVIEVYLALDHFAQGEY